jgi:hypothetical protein
LEDKEKINSNKGSVEINSKFEDDAKRTTEQQTPTGVISYQCPAQLPAGVRETII